METINKMKKQPVDWEKILTSHISDKRVISKICEGLINSNTHKKITQLRNGQRTRKDISPKTYTWSTGI